MLFPTVTFALFFVVVLAANWLLGAAHPIVWKLGLLTAGAVFYGWWDARYLLLLAAVVVGTDAVARAMTRWPRQQNLLMALGILADIGVLGFYKYYGFFRESLVDALSPFGLEPSPPLLRIVLPIGVSFYLFEAIAYLIEIQRGVVPRIPLLDLAVHLSFFPKLLAGPITRPSELAPHLAGPAADIDASRAMWLVARGLLKKLVIATYLADHLTDDVFASPAQHSATEVLFAIYGYTAQIYVDFSAYTDMAIGLALLLGITLPENFDRPYAATSVQDFWTRWHMTLSRWFRDFVFQPLALHRGRGTAATVRNIMIVMLLTGLWHGAAWTYVVWGGLHGLVMVAERLRREGRRRRRLPKPVNSRTRRLVTTALTFHFIALSWVVFRADSLGRALDVFARLGAFGPADRLTPLYVAVVAAVLGAQWLPPDWARRVQDRFVLLAAPAQVALLAMAVFIADALGPQGVAPFIYFGF